ncbi:cation channel family transporter [Aspergillus luchuensis]|uniref:Cation channel family transporter n=1 Tax=Aspergillus kawachii TaxID=1069201 RepID=A0A146FD58_ASPKA|nr:cation channel family transporter [Aspergillus luchuensis]
MDMDTHDTNLRQAQTHKVYVSENIILLTDQSYRTLHFDRASTADTVSYCVQGLYEKCKGM